MLASARSCNDSFAHFLRGSLTESLQSTGLPGGSRRELRQRQRYVPKSNIGCIGDGIGNRRSGWPLHRFTRAEEGRAALSPCAGLSKNLLEARLISALVSLASSHRGLALGHATPSSSEALLQRCRTSANGARAQVPAGKPTRTEVPCSR
jgi:hypothetical protein